MLERFNPDKHIPLIEEWITAHGQAFDSKRGYYPDTGLIADGCACAFLYLTNAPLVGYIDNCIGDPRVPGDRRRKAIDVLCGALVREAKSRGIEMVFAFTAHKSLVDICKANGMQVFGDGYSCLAGKL